MDHTTPGPRTLAEPLDVILRDGGTLRLHPPTRTDSDKVLDLLAGLSERSLFLRFHGVPKVRPQLVDPFLDPDWVDRGALIGTLADASNVERVVALASYARLRDPDAAEVAFVVADDHQGRGIGTRLLEQLAARAASVGIEHFVAEVRPENQPMLHVFEDAGFEVSRVLESGTVEVTFPIEPTEEYLAHVDERDHLAVVASLRPFFAPASVVVIGASTRRDSIGGLLFRNVLAAEFTGAAYPVNRTGEPVAGVRGYSSVDELPETPDLAVICLPGKHVLPAAEAALRHGISALCVISAGFAETGLEGLERERELVALVRSHGARLIGPNCLGIAVAGARLNATFGPHALPPGTIGFSSQSGALGLALLEKAAERNLGLSSFISIGNKADVSSNDLLEYWEDDPQTNLVLLYLESFGNPRRFGRIARRVARRKPILAMKSGTTSSGARAASSHTAALAGSEAAVEALFHQTGVLRAETLEELIDASALLSTQPLPAGRSVAVLTNAGGLGILAADACDAEGLELPDLSDETKARLAELLPAEASLANPVDMLGSATAESYESVVPALLRDARVDALIVLFVPPVTAGADEVAAAVLRAVERADVPDKPVLGAILSAEGTPAALQGTSAVAVFPYPESAARALGLAARRAEWLRRPAGSVPALDGVDVQTARALVERVLGQKEELWLGADDLRALLEAYGIPFVSERVADTAEEAASAAGELGYPAVVKTARAGAHKTETGGIALGLEDEAAVREALDRIGLPALVQPMIEGGAELLAGIVQDPTFGPLVAFGPGGIFAELIGEAGFRIAPLTDADADELVNTGKTGRLVAGYRGAPAVDSDALEDLLHRLSRLGEDLPEVAELDLNPVLAQPDGCIAVDARARVRRPEVLVRAKTW
ncbi:MAG TPA: GNAT family N-acetyltransferase [Gaiellaceae bacterium]|nr:GNAT family N-acetyltransferase [Gaiellaceae bacterium]